MDRKLPNLSYVGDVPVEASYHGSLLLYRLLEAYPCDKLCIAEGNLYRSKPERRLKDVRYKSLAIGVERLLRTRFHKFYRNFLTRIAPKRVRSIEGSMAGFEPQAVLTVTHGCSWITAARFAAKHQLPLHLICHDDWPRLVDLSARARRQLDETFGSVYRQAASRLCISPYMQEAYRQRYGAEGNVLLPSRSADCQNFDSPPSRLLESNHKFTVAFAGTINSPSYFWALRVLADVLEQMGGRLLIFGPLSEQGAGGTGLGRKNVELRGLIPPDGLIEQLRRDVDVLFLPMSFDERDRANMELSFPSKLTDYTAAGLPVLIHGPEYCSAVRWGRENEPVAEIVTKDSLEALSAAVERLRNPSRRFELARRAVEIGRQFFSNAAAYTVFLRALDPSRATSAIAQLKFE